MCVYVCGWGGVGGGRLGWLSSAANRRLAPSCNLIHEKASSAQTYSAMGTAPRWSPLAAQRGKPSVSSPVPTGQHTVQGVVMNYLLSPHSCCLNPPLLSTLFFSFSSRPSRLSAALPLLRVVSRNLSQSAFAHFALCYHAVMLSCYV